MAMVRKRPRADDGPPVMGQAIAELTRPPRTCQEPGAERRRGGRLRQSGTRVTWEGNVRCASRLRAAGGRVMNGALERLAGLAARRWWVFLVSWVIILGGLLAAKNGFGGEYVNNYTVSGSDSATGLNVLNSTFPQQAGYSGQIVFHAT